MGWGRCPMTSISFRTLSSRSTVEFVEEDRGVDSTLRRVKKYYLLVLSLAYTWARVCPAAVLMKHDLLGEKRLKPI